MRCTSSTRSVRSARRSARRDTNYFTTTFWFDGVT
jgi:hypothetical protein